MKIAICCNHSMPHCGGSEYIIQQIAESMQKDYNHNVVIFSKSILKSIIYNDIKIIPCFNDNVFLSQISNFDHILIYSDYFCYWPLILKNREKISAKISIALVGMNRMLSGGNSDKNCFDLFIKKYKQFNVITHSDNYLDYKKCREYKIPVNVIHNFVNLEKFKKEIDFRKKYKIDTQYIVLCVSNFFYGKGQENLVKILNILSETRDDFTVVFISNKVNFRPSKILSLECKKQLNRSSFKYKFLENIPRKDVISSFFDSDVFAFPSQKEVSPIVILESMAAELPWVSFPVGNTTQLKGGIISEIRGIDEKNNLICDSSNFKYFANCVGKILDDKEIEKKLKKEGKEQIEKEYNYKKIMENYNQIFIEQSYC